MPANNEYYLTENQANRINRMLSWFESFAGAPPRNLQRAKPFEKSSPPRGIKIARGVVTQKITQDSPGKVQETVWVSSTETWTPIGNSIENVRNGLPFDDDDDEIGVNDVVWMVFKFLEWWVIAAQCPTD